MRILITGAAGFIGGRLAQFLAGRGNQVTGYDLNDPARGKVEGWTGSVLNEQQFACALHTSRPDVVIHAAGFLGVEKTEAEPGKCLEINIDGTKIVSQQCARMGIQHLIYLSSSEVYGASRECPTPETADLLGWSPYAISKIAAEAWTRCCGAPYTIVRPFNIYGPGQREDFVIPRFIRQIKNGEPLTVYGFGSQSRSFCYVDDLCAAIEAMLMNQGAMGGAFNVGNDSEPIEIAALADLLETIAAKHGLFSSSRILGGRADRLACRDISRRIPCIVKAFRILGWQPDVRLAEGLERTISS